MSYPTEYTTYVNNVIKVFRDYFNLQEYGLKVAFMDESEDRGNRTLLATILVDTRYLTILIRIFPEVYEYYKRKDYSSIAEVLTHEFCHTLFQPVWDRIDRYVSQSEQEDIANMFEQQVQRTANVIFQSIPPQYFTPSANAKPKVRKLKSRKTKNR